MTQEPSSSPFDAVTDFIEAARDPEVSRWSLLISSIAIVVLWLGTLWCPGWADDLYESASTLGKERGIVQGLVCLVAFVAFAAAFVAACCALNLWGPTWTDSDDATSAGERLPKSDGQFRLFVASDLLGFLHAVVFLAWWHFIVYHSFRPFIN